MQLVFTKFKDSHANILILSTNLNLSGVKIRGLVPLRVFKSKTTTIRVILVPFTVLSRKNTTGTGCVLELVPFRSANEFEAHPQNEILVPFKGIRSDRSQSDRSNKKLDRSTTF